VFHTDDELLSLATNIGIGRKCLPDTNTNTLAYFAGASETKKKVIVQISVVLSVIMLSVFAPKISIEVENKTWLEKKSKLRNMNEAIFLFFLPDLGVNVVKLFSFVADEEAEYARAFVPGIHFEV
jgi:hypothetical protein